MKTVFTILGLLITTLSFSQTQNLEGNVTTEELKTTNLGVSVTVDSAEDVASTFDIKDIRNILNDVDDNEALSFEITCNEEAISKNVSKKVSYRITGNSNDKNAFLKNVKKIRKAAIKFYENK